jgi:hypothetical protein
VRARFFDTPDRPSACVGALGHVAFRYTDSVGTQNQFSIAAQWLACTFPYRRFADILADTCARLGADVVRYSFIVVDLHHLLLAGLPAHLCENSARYNRTQNFEACGHAQSKKMQKFVLRSALRPNQISFSHSLGQSQTQKQCPQGRQLSSTAAVDGRGAMTLARRRFLHLAAGAAAMPVVSRVATAQTGKVERPGGFEVDHQFELRRLNNRSSPTLRRRRDIFSHVEKSAEFPQGASRLRPACA